MSRTLHLFSCFKIIIEVYGYCNFMFSCWLDLWLPIGATEETCFSLKTTHHRDGFTWQEQPSGRWDEACLTLPQEEQHLGNWAFWIQVRSDASRMCLIGKASKDRPRSRYFILQARNAFTEGNAIIGSCFRTSQEPPWRGTPLDAGSARVKHNHNQA